MRARLPIAALLALGVLASLPAETRTVRKNGFDLCNALVPVREIRQGGPDRDGIPALLHPRFVTADSAAFLADEDRVIGLQLNGVSKAYPIRILNYHEIVNDRLGDTRVAVTFCPLCGSGLVFDSGAGGQGRTFGVSGLLLNSNVLMYDHQSESLWSQIRSQAISGPAAGTVLVAIPALHTTWESWRRAHPGTLVLEPPAGSGARYNVDPYHGYADSKRVWFPVAHKDKRYPAKAVVVGVVIDDIPKAYPFPELPASKQQLQDAIGDTPVTLEYDTERQAARVLDASDRELPSFTTYWFAWVAFHPDTLVYRPPAEPRRP